MFFSKWRSRRAAALSKPRQLPRVPDGQIIYAIGDIHGRLDLLQRAADAIARDVDGLPSGEPVTIFVGDYIDRGPSSGAVLDRLASSTFPTPIMPLLGNHETMLLNFLQDASAMQRWRGLGGLETLHSYGVDVREAMAGRDFEVAQYSFRRSFPEEHRQFLLQLPRSVVRGDYLFCHAGVRPGVPLAEQDPYDLICIRDEFLTSDIDHGKVIVHGHTPVPQPDFRPNRINLDTGAFATGRLTCLRLLGETQSLIAV
jgi:serine/threonine protein phosphatase 1